MFTRWFGGELEYYAGGGCLLSRTPGLEVVVQYTSVTLRPQIDKLP